jgi:bleomycin hydrolase
VVGGRKTIYNNQPIEVLMDATAKSIKNGEAVWFGCEVRKPVDMTLKIMLE